ncbi:hypothetical protein J3R82DRAFT_4324 [Butyriboletus roseoflavus]|nr:hypothetical protein J3R82DRAFT_4324 [Butyriboletus roseoflavus]
MVAEDDVDMESLQAQIDMSMSFAQNLVTSWIKPTHLAQLRPNGVNAAQILEEESRRPPRYPTMLCELWTSNKFCTDWVLLTRPPNSSVGLGKNGTKNGDVVQSPPQDSSKSDNEEHKGRPVKQKTKVDPFRHEGSKKKKRKANSEANRFPSAENPTLGEPPKHSKSYSFCPSCSIVTAPCRKEKKRMGPDDQQSATLISSPSLRSPVQTTFSSSPTAPKPSRETYGALISLHLLSTHLPHFSLGFTSSGFGKNNNFRIQSSAH